MQIHGPSQTVDAITVRLTRPFAVIDFGGTSFFIESIADADELIKAVVAAKDLLLGETSEPAKFEISQGLADALSTDLDEQDDAGRAIAADDCSCAPYPSGADRDCPLHNSRCGCCGELRGECQCEAECGLTGRYATAQDDAGRAIANDLAERAWDGRGIGAEDIEQANGGAE